MHVCVANSLETASVIILQGCVFRILHLCAEHIFRVDFVVVPKSITAIFLLANAVESCALLAIEILVDGITVLHLLLSRLVLFLCDYWRLVNLLPSTLAELIRLHAHRFVNANTRTQLILQTHLLHDSSLEDGLADRLKLLGSIPSESCVNVSAAPVFLFRDWARRLLLLIHVAKIAARPGLPWVDVLAGPAGAALTPD